MYVCLLTHRLTPTLWLPTEIKKSIFNHQKLIMRSRTWFYFLWGERGNVLLTTWGLVFSPKQKRGEITYFKPFSRHTCCDFGNHVYSLAYHSTYAELWNSIFQKKGNEWCKLGGQVLFVLLHLYTSPAWKRYGYKQWHCLPCFLSQSVQTNSCFPGNYWVTIIA